MFLLRKKSLPIILFGIFVLAVVSFCTGFIVFINHIQSTQSATLKQAHAIVALTGGPHRIEVAVNLLSQGKARRLLISGVNTSTSRNDLTRHMPEYAELFGCCIDLGKVARNTIGNATETKQWIEENGFSSLIVVTASYHMPRSLVELRTAMPNVDLIPYPVNSSRMHIQEWWAHPGTLLLLVKEYVKTLPAIARLCLSRLTYA